MSKQKNKEIVKLKELLNKKDLDPKVRESVEKRLKTIENDTTILK